MNLPDVITKTAIKNNFLIAHKGIINRIIFKINCSVAVSYTHLDVYKRQSYNTSKVITEEIYLLIFIFKTPP